MGCRRLLRILVPLALVRADIELSCKGYKYGEIDWDEVRTTLEVYADKYMDRPQLLAKEFQLASAYALEYHPENQCILGDLALRLLLWLQVDDGTLRSAVATLAAGGPHETGIEPLMEETYNWFWSLQLSWSDLLASGWPLFSIIASVAERVRDETREACVAAETLQLYVDSFDDAVYVPMHVDTTTLLEAPHCLDAVATALISLADNHRIGATRDGNRYYRYSAASLASQPSETDTPAMVARVERMLRQNRSWDLLTSRWPMWRFLDRLSATEVVNVSATSGGKPFWMYVFPHRVRSDGLISNRIRGTHSAYCLQLFQDEVLRLAAEASAAEASARGSSSSSAASSRRPLCLVDAGPHIGDCLLWASAALGESRPLRGLAVEPVAQVVDRFRRSIAANGFDIDLRHAWLGDKSTATGAENEVPWVRMDDLLDEDIDIFKIHTNGGERQILDGAAGLFSRHKVRVVIVHSAEQDQLWNSAVFLLDRGYTVRVNGRSLTLRDEALVKGLVSERGGMQLHALA